MNFARGLIDNHHKFVVIIENKIRSSEHSNQLQRYPQIVDQNNAGWNVISIFLTPDGEIPSDELYIALITQLSAELLKG